MNYSCDIDLFRGWAEAACYGRLSQDTTKKYNAAMIFKRAAGRRASCASTAGLQPAAHAALRASMSPPSS
jgi:hypothetical protein